MLYIFRITDMLVTGLIYVPFNWQLKAELPFSSLLFIILFLE